MDYSSSAVRPSSTGDSSVLYAFRFNSFSTERSSWTYTALAILASLLVLEQAVYRYKKRHLPGATWTIPLIGKFADSMSPSMDGYKKTWATPLSAISVFNMCVSFPSSPSALTSSASSSWPRPTSSHARFSTHPCMRSPGSSQAAERSSQTQTG